MARAEELVQRIEQLETEIDSLLETDCARPSLIPPALTDFGSASPPFIASSGPTASVRRKAGKRSAAQNRRGTEIGQRIRAARLALGMTQLDLATATGIRRPNVARLERGRNTPTIETLQRVAEALCVSVVSLVSGA
jgi:ribosome-binding protein aMBF1 (putative translation factor)